MLYLILLFYWQKVAGKHLLLWHVFDSNFGFTLYGRTLFGRPVEIHAFAIYDEVALAIFSIRDLIALLHIAVGYNVNY